MEKTLLILSPHPDDAELGAGGSLARWLEEGWKPHIAIFSDCEASLPSDSAKDLLVLEFHQSMDYLGISSEDRHIFNFPVRHFPKHRQEILENLVGLRHQISPSLVLLPSSQDQHQDHQVISSEGLRAFRSTSTIYGYELPWNIINLTGNHFVELDRDHIDKKVAAIACYQSQVKLGRPYFQEGLVEAAARLRGAQCSMEFAEAFEVLRSRE